MAAGACRVDLGSEVIDAIDLRGVPAIEDPVAISPDPVAQVGQNPSRQERACAVAGLLARQNAQFPLQLNTARMVDVGDKSLLTRIDAYVHVPVV
jgi:hypothetical protein